jgi:DNA (cytosine-5)-methyltransferase 1
LLGIREDLAANLGDFERLQLIESAPTVRHVISDLPKLRSRLSKGIDTVEAWRKSITGISNETLKQLKHDNQVPTKVYDCFVEQLDNIKDSSVLVGQDRGLERQHAYNEHLTTELQEWYRDDRLGNYVANHEARGHIIGDLHRYLYYSTFAKTMEMSLTSKNLPKALWPNHKNFETGKFADRFRVQRSGSPGTTITSHISKDGHYFIHYDPNQCRSLTVREAARIQTFPDNYYFVGNRTQQYVQVGNAVPPYLAAGVAKIVYGLLQ